MPLFGGGEELYAVKSTLETLVRVGVVGGVAILGGLYFLRSEAQKKQQQRQKLYQDMEQIPAEQRPAVMQLLQDLREGSPTKAAYGIDHLLDEYQQP